MSKKGFTEEQLKTFKNVESLLHGMLGDRSVPRNIKRVAQQGINILQQGQQGNESPGILASNILYLVVDVSQDPNIPFASRTTIYRIISLLETVRD
jgi:uncharacterized protein (UPF0147 family)